MGGSWVEGEEIVPKKVKIGQKSNQGRRRFWRVVNFEELTNDCILSLYDLGKCDSLGGSKVDHCGRGSNQGGSSSEDFRHCIGGEDYWLDLIDIYEALSTY